MERRDRNYRNRRSFRQARINIARTKTLEILNRVEEENAYASILLSNLLNDPNVEPRDARLAQRITLGVLESVGELDSILDPFVKGGIDSLPPALRQVLRIGAYQILYLDKIPKEIAVFESVELARSATRNQGLVKLVNAVLRKVTPEMRDSTPAPDTESSESDGEGLSERISREHSHPTWLVSRWLTRYGESETVALCKANNTRWPLAIRFNTSLVSRELAIRHLANEGVIAHPSKYSSISATIDALPPKKRLDQLKTFQLGEWIVQDESSTLVVDLLDPQPGEQILDLCSAPGGKTTDIAARVKDGEVLALDRSNSRLDLVRENATRLGLNNIHAQEGDGATFSSPRKFDRVLIDVPCSGIGVLGRKKEIRWNKDDSIFAELREIQLSLLRNGASLVKLDGVVVYSTCSIEPDEDELIVQNFLSENQDFIRIDPPGSVKRDLVTKDGFLRTFPHKHGIGGAFGAALRRIR